MQKHFVKLRKAITSIAFSPLILISNNTELAAKYLPSKINDSLDFQNINKFNNNLLIDFDDNKQMHF